MMNEILSLWTPGPIIIVVSLIVFVIPVVLIILFVRYLVRSNKERRRLRLELGKLADELEQVQQKMKADQKDNSSGESG